MTDQTPPPDHPTPPKAEGVGPVEGAPPPPPPPAEPPADQAVGAESPPPAPKSRRGLLISLIAGLLALALIGGALAVFFVTRGPDKHSITVTSTAGGMKRDTVQEKKLKKELDATGKQFETQFKVTSAKSGLYKQDSTSRGPKGQLLFMGFKFKTPSEKNPANLVKKLRTIADGNKLEVTNVPVGDAGGKAICIGSPAAAAQKTSSCFWATRDSGGGLFPNVEGYDSKQLSKILLDLRTDVEKTE